MSPMWMPQYPPPCDISGLSPAAEKIWQELLKRHKEKEYGPGKVNRNYYQAMYTRKFGAPPLPRPCTSRVGTCSSIGTPTPCRAGMHQTSCNNTPHTLSGFPVSSSTSSIGGVWDFRVHPRNPTGVTVPPLRLASDFTGHGMPPSQGNVRMDSDFTGRGIPPSRMDADFTGRGIPPSRIDADFTGREIPPSRMDADFTSHGMPPSRIDADFTGREIPPSRMDADVTGRGIPPSRMDADFTGRGIPPSRMDADVTGRGIPPRMDADFTGRGIPPSRMDADFTGRGIPPSRMDADFTGRGIPPSRMDADFTGRGIPPSRMDADFTGRGIPPSRMDADFTGRGIPPSRMDGIIQDSLPQAGQVSRTQIMTQTPDSDSPPLDLDSSEWDMFEDPLLVLGKPNVEAPDFAENTSAEKCQSPSGQSSRGSPSAHSQLGVGQSSRGSPSAHGQLGVGQSSRGAPSAHGQLGVGQSSRGSPSAHDQLGVGQSSRGSPSAHAQLGVGQSSRGSPSAHDQLGVGQSSRGSPSAHAQLGVGQSSRGSPSAHAQLGVAGGQLTGDQQPGHLLESSSRKRSSTMPCQSPADKDLQELEALVEQNSSKSKRPKKPAFMVPLKKLARPVGGHSPNPISKTRESRPAAQDRGHIRQLKHLSMGERKSLQQNLKTAEEVALTLVYMDGSTQLRPPKECMKHKSMTSKPKVKSVAIAYPRKDSSGSRTISFVMIPLVNLEGCGLTWTRDLLAELLIGKTRKLCYGGHELIMALTNIAAATENTVVTRWSVMDPAIAHWLLDSDHPPQCFKDVLAGVPHLKQRAALSPEEAICEDLTLLGPVMVHLYHQLRAANLWYLFLHVETPLTTILAVMDRRGIQVDTKVLLDMADILADKLSQLERDAHTAAKRRFSLNSHVQLRQVLFEELKLDQRLTQKTRIARTSVHGQKSTSEAVLSQLSNMHPLPAIVLEHRQLQKLKSTYVDGMMACVKDGELVTHWDQTAAATGRLTSTRPNIQAIPKQPVLITKQSKAIIGSEAEQVEVWARDAFISRPRCVFLAAGGVSDFQQMELRILAHLAADPTMLRIFTPPKSEDIFVELTSQWLGKATDSVTSGEREQTKRVVYSVMYGAGKERLAEYLKISSDEAKNIISSFLVRFPGVNSFTKSCVEEARKKGYQTTLFGRRRLFPHINHPAGHLRAQAERQAVNFCVQGSAADLCKIAMIQVERALADKPHLEARILVQIHDELLLEVQEAQLVEAARLVQAIMADSTALGGTKVRLLVPLQVSLSVGATWGHMAPYNLEGQLCTV